VEVNTMFWIGLLIGAIIGAGIMVFVYKNNIGKATMYAEEMEKKYNELKAAVKEKAGKV
jgi:glycerol uptake facilitator-like aquaporin